MSLWLWEKIQILSWKSGVKVAVAIICDEHQRILLTQRPHHVPHGGLWEFPGGKLEPNETAEQALVREIKEEVGLDVLKHQFIGEVSHQYVDKTVHLHIFAVTHFEGNPVCRESQLGMKWVQKDRLNPSMFPEANHSVIDMICSMEFA